MTRYLLNSGNVWGDKDKAKQFFTEMLDQVQDRPPKMLICTFAKARERWEESIASHSRMPSTLGREVEIVMAEPDLFESQCREADVIYITGGDDTLLQYWLGKFDLASLFAGKTVGANSAGSDAICNSSWVCDWRKCIDGFGLVDIKFISHFKDWNPPKDPRGPIDWQAAHDQLAEYGNKTLPIHALRESDWVTIEVE